ncbi:uncharacterized protein LOC110371656 [Helicoverpa armigera]|uniref:uncharacterized protein LOC110371656 n=1 Tax=Helicoverpa armigera TaxID=29058 RepID=UPI000B37790E|nr:uncharacterized protein LOC110371656 [Helicoverpa armigera]PZC82678.1 hypothetical protein B5X24_HaOG209776 [Helicoverpa armigera]
MDAPRPMRILCLLALFHVASSALAHDVPKHVDDQKLEVYDGVYVTIPKDNDSGRLFSVELDTDRSVVEGRGKKKNIMQRILPMFILPFVLQSAIMPLVMGMLKFMLVKSFLVGKLALTLIMINAFKNHNSFKGRDAEMASAHYGYHDNGIEHYTSYLN